jgi:hypothetical protein
VADEAKLIIQVPRGSTVDLSLKADPPAAIADVRVIVEHLPAAGDGTLAPPPAGEVVLTVPSPEALRREPGAVRRAVTGAGPSGPPLVVLIDGAQALRDDELNAVLDAALATGRMVILRVLDGV